MSDQLHKIVYLVWPPDGQTLEETRSLLLDACAPELVASVALVQINVHDVSSQVRSPAPSLLLEQPVRAQVNVWVAELDERFAAEDILRRRGFQIAGYLVDEQIYTEYGGNAHGAPRSWPDGERSPGVLAVTLLERPRRLAYDEWISRWHGRQSPVSEAMQPRTRYVRNVVQRPLTPAAPAFEGIVEESWPSFRYVTNPYLFYGADSTLALLRNMWVMLRSVTSFLTLWRIRTVMMSEYFVATRFDESATRTAIDLE